MATKVNGTKVHTQLPAVLSPPSRPPVDALDMARRLLAAFLSGRSALTISAYAHDLEGFREFVQAPAVEDAVRELLCQGPGPANELALRFKTSLFDRGLAPATINRRLAALRSMVHLGRTLGFVAWTLEVQNIKTEAYRDTRGPGTNGVGRMLSTSTERTDGKGIRDLAIVRLLWDLALRRIEVVRLDLEDLNLDLEPATIAVLGKGKTQKEHLTLPPQTKSVLESWLQFRGKEPGPLFMNFDRARKGDGRLTGAGIYELVCKLGRETDQTVHPHGFRHAAITEALDVTGGDIRAVQRFSRHKDMRTLLHYDDNRADLGGEVARKVAAAAG